MQVGSAGASEEDEGVDIGDGWGLRERCIHQTRGGFLFRVKSLYLTGAGVRQPGRRQQKEEGLTETGGETS